MAKFDKNKLKAVETTEKNVLPTADDIKQAKEVEKTHWDFVIIYDEAENAIKFFENSSFVINFRTFIQACTAVSGLCVTYDK